MARVAVVDSALAEDVGDELYIVEFDGTTDNVKLVIKDAQRMKALEERLKTSSKRLTLESLRGMETLRFRHSGLPRKGTIGFDQGKQR